MYSNSHSALRYTHTCTQPFYGSLDIARTTRVSRYRKKQKPTHTHVVINHPLSASSICYNPWHPPGSIYVPGRLFPQSHSGTARVNEGSHSFIRHRHVHPQTEWAVPAFTRQLQNIISCLTDGRRLRWPAEVKLPRKESFSSGQRIIQYIWRLYWQHLWNRHYDSP